MSKKSRQQYSKILKRRKQNLVLMEMGMDKNYGDGRGFENLVFFRKRRILSRLMFLSLGRRLTALVSNWIVQRLAPLGGALQAKATISACWSVPYFCGCPVRATSCKA